MVIYQDSVHTEQYRTGTDILVMIRKLSNNFASKYCSKNQYPNTKQSCESETTNTGISDW
jgi:hypothetical protein